jgi:hypothetical protein
MMPVMVETASRSQAVRIRIPVAVQMTQATAEIASQSRVARMQIRVAIPMTQVTVETVQGAGAVQWNRVALTVIPMMKRAKAAAQHSNFDRTIN